MKRILREEILPYLPQNLRRLIEKIDPQIAQKLEEIRLRAGRPLMLVLDSSDLFINLNGEIAKYGFDPFIVSKEEVAKTLELMAENSIYAVQEDIKQGFLTLKGGHRVGITGKVIFDKYGIKNIRDFSGLNIRISRQVIGCADRVISYLINQQSVLNTLMISPPQCGKTTIIRDVARQIGSGIERIGFRGVKVGIVDERSEIASCYKGIPQNDVGLRTDILDSCPKSIGMITLLRSMSPEVIITDELGSESDKEAVMQTINAGVTIITTAHGAELIEVEKRPYIGDLIAQKVFARVIILSRRNGPGTIEIVMDGKSSNVIYKKEG